jgi:hypothetical protein
MHSRFRLGTAGLTHTYLSKLVPDCTFAAIATSRLAACPACTQPEGRAVPAASVVCCRWQHEQYQCVALLCCRSSSKDITELHDFVLSVADRINKKYSCGSYLPVVWVERPVSLCEKIALYSTADVAVVTATRDGMNLVPYEYIVCRQGAPVSPLPWLTLSCPYAPYTVSHPASHALAMQMCCFACVAYITAMRDSPGLMLLQ